MLTAIGILVILIVGMDAGISAGVRAYSDAVFEANSASVAGILNNAIGDVLRYSEDIIKNPSIENSGVPGFKDSEDNILTADQVPFVFSNFEYGVRNGYFDIVPVEKGKDGGMLVIRDLQNSPKGLPPRKLVNTGAYPELAVANLTITYVETGHYFNVKYEILDQVKTDREGRTVEYTVRVLNPET